MPNIKNCLYEAITALDTFQKYDKCILIIESLKQTMMFRIVK